MSEKQMWGYLQPRLPLHCERLTDRIQEGLPDVLYVRDDGATGLVELKYLPALPQNLSATPVLTYGSHGLQTAQAFWLNRWARRGGRAGVLLRVGTHDWFYWRAEPSPNWIPFIRSVDAVWYPTWRWKAYNGSLDLDVLAGVLCK
jgi:hypothetical protein